MGPDTVAVRSATEVDAAEMLAIYRPYVESSTVSFEETPPSLEEFQARVRKYLSNWSCLIAVSGVELLGYAYGGIHRERAAYRWSVETSVYVKQGLHRRGIGRRLYGELMPRLRDAGYCNAYAGVTLPNDASVALHLAMGFRPVGTFPRVGYKFGQWRDVAWFHLPLREAPPADSLDSGHASRLWRVRGSESNRSRWQPNSARDNPGPPDLSSYSSGVLAGPEAEERSLASMERSTGATGRSNEKLSGLRPR